MKSKKIFQNILIFSMVMALFTGCTVNNTDTNVETEVRNAPAVIAKTNGGEKWETKIDYANADNWLSAEDTGKDVDVVYFYPTTFSKVSDDAPDVADITDESMRSGAQRELKNQASVFIEDCNIYAPFYRQVNAAYALTLSDEEADDLLRYSASQDPSAALDYYFENYNNGKPFILAGHSQGSQILTMILSDYMKVHPEHYKKMIAAYVIGYSVTDKYLAANPHLKFAEGADDTGVIISYNTEGPANKDQHNAVVTDGAISINPINWKKDDTYAAKEENLGSLNIDGEIEKNLADAKIDLERGVVVCETADSAVYAIPEAAHALFGPESYHGYDYGLYYMNLRENAKVRIEAFKNK